MKKLLALTLSLNCLCASAAPAPLLERALSCQLNDTELATLMREVATANSGMKKPAKQHGAPTLDVYRLTAPLKAFGYASSTIVVMPGRIMLAVPGETVDSASVRLKLEKSDYAPAGRVVRPTVSVVALQLSAQPVEGQLLVGCEYANPAAAAWIAADGF